jgi:hypothetical protein
MEVMIACAIFFMAIFAILALVSGTLRNARGLRHSHVDAGIVAAFAFRTNRLSEGVDGPNDLGDLGYQDYSYTMECHEHETFTNGLVEVNFVLLHKGNPVDNLTVWRFDPNFHSSMSHGGIGR